MDLLFINSLNDLFPKPEYALVI